MFWQDENQVTKNRPVRSGLDTVSLDVVLDAREILNIGKNQAYVLDSPVGILIP